MRSGELFAGVGGLGMAVDEVFGSTPAWFAEFDAAPSKVLAHHFPDVPNYGDVTKIHNPPKVNILAGGFPCQDVSLAGRRRGMKNGTRSGLWSEYARIIDETRPDWVVIENVRGLLSADAAVDMEPCPLCVGDNPEHVLRALGAVLGDLAELGFDAEWIGLRAADIGAPHGRFRVFILAWPRERTISHTDRDGRIRIRGVDSLEHDAHGRSRSNRPREGSESAAPLKLLSTPDTVPEAPNTGSNSHKAGNIVGLGNQIMSLLPTPGAYQPGGSQHPDKRRAGGHALNLQDVTEHLDNATNWGPYAYAIARWESVIGRPAPSPVRNDGKGGKPRLNSELTEWMMGWPLGWVTDPAIGPREIATPEPFVNKTVSGLTRAEQLKACGNGVVPQQAAAALRELLARPGVPRIESK